MLHKTYLGFMVVWDILLFKVKGAQDIIISELVYDIPMQLVVLQK